MFHYQEPFPLGEDTTEYRCLTRDFVTVRPSEDGGTLVIDPKALTLLAREALADVNFYLRTSHLKQVAKILDDPEASANDRFVAMTLLQNAVVSAKGELPGCQDTGTAIVMAKKGEHVRTGGHDEAAISKGIFEAYQARNLRYSQLAPLSMFEEKNTGTNLPAQIDIQAAAGGEYRFLFLAKGGGSANKSFLYQQSKALLTESALTEFLKEKLVSIGTAACPPYHLVIVVGGTSAEATLKAVKLASTGYWDTLPTRGSEFGQAFRDLEWEKKVFKIAEESGIGAQFGGKYLVHDVRVIRLPRHAASCPVGIGVSCSADRNIKGKITRDGIFLEQLETHPEQFLPSAKEREVQAQVPIDLDRPFEEVIAELAKYPVKTRLSLSGTLIVARDVAHAKILSLVQSGKPVPDYFKKFPIYYAGPAKTPAGMPTGSFGPTTAARMDPYAEPFMKLGASRIMIGKGNRSAVVAESCKKYKGFYLGSIGGPAAVLAQENILSSEVIDFEELGMEAVRKIRVKDFPAFLICDSKGHDFFAQLGSRGAEV